MFWFLDARKGGEQVCAIGMGQASPGDLVGESNLDRLGG